MHPQLLMGEAPGKVSGLGSRLELVEADPLCLYSDLALASRFCSAESCAASEKPLRHMKRKMMRANSVGKSSWHAWLDLHRTTACNKRNLACFPNLWHLPRPHP
jgi:hypothetical protein